MSTIEHVSDTALMVAACRAIETERPDGLVRDPFAASLAGEKGMAIARAAPGLMWMTFGIGIRSRFIDELLAERIRQKRVETVLNLGAGLDTRPWRMDLPGDLRWIEVDFPAMLDYKCQRLEARRPRCILERMPADVSNPDERAKVFAALGSKPALMMTEGLLFYLPRTTITALAGESAAASGIGSWIFDVSSLDLMRHSHRELTDRIESVRAPDHLNAREILDAVTAKAWRVAEFRSYLRDSVTIARDRIAQMVGSAQPRPERAPDDDPSGVYAVEPVR